MASRVGTDAQGRELHERVVEINRVAKVVKGGRRFSFTALVVVGDEIEQVGVGYGKANEVPVAIQKAIEDAKKNLFTVPRHHTTITHEITGVYGAGKVLLKPASQGTGVIAGAGVRAVLELAGLKDVLAKSLGTSTPINLCRAAEVALRGLRRPEDVARLHAAILAFFQRDRIEAELFLPWSDQRARGEVFAACEVLGERADGEGAWITVRGDPATEHTQVGTQHGRRAEGPLDVFIGRNLDRDELNSRFRACLVK